MAKHRAVAPERQMDRALLVLREQAAQPGAAGEAARVLLWEVDRAMIAGNDREVRRILRPLVRALPLAPKIVTIGNWRADLLDDDRLDERFTEWLADYSFDQARHWCGENGVEDGVEDGTEEFDAVRYLIEERYQDEHFRREAEAVADAIEAICNGVQAGASDLRS